MFEDSNKSNTKKKGIKAKKAYILWLNVFNSNKLVVVVK